MPLLLPTRILRAASQNAKPVKWSETLNLPKSAFPARPTAGQLDNYRQRCAGELYSWQLASRPPSIKDGNGQEVNNEFTLHDGPPYANGAVHVGHALNKVLKDVIGRWQLATGKRVHYRPGWDCHGLPIELKALQAQRTKTEQTTALKDAPTQEAIAAASGAGMSATEVRKVARALATETIEKQKASFKQWGVMGEWDVPYKTMDSDFEIAQLGVFREMVRKGLISRHHRPVYWSPSSRTALAEAELEYDDKHECTAAFVRMPFVCLPPVLRGIPHIQRGLVSALIWTTTPWTLPANMAVAVKDDLEYCVIRLMVSHQGSECDHDRDMLLIAKERVEHVLSHLGHRRAVVETVVDTITGSQLAEGGAACYNIFLGAESPILKADFVTATSGTGLVHCAPGHGMEDYQLCQQNDVGPAIAPVDDEGCYTAEVFPANASDRSLRGLDVQTKGADAVLDLLRDAETYLPSSLQPPPTNLVLATHKFTHKNPIDWRTKQPVIVRATAQWFADVSAIKDKAQAAIKDVRFIPESGRTRLGGFIDGRSRWCISRQRAWGVPIPALFHKETGEACISEESIDHIIATIKRKGTDAWFSDPPDDQSWLHPSLDAGMWVRGKDTMDVWFDSGTTWTTLNGKGSDIYLEGTDQHRGWFQSSLLTSVATQDERTKPRAPFNTLITHGFVLDAKGSKMSKSLGNVISPDQVLDGSLLPPVKTKKQRGKKTEQVGPKKEEPTYDVMGPDVLRLWVANSDYTSDVSISVPVLQEIQHALQKYRTTFRFLLGVLADYTLPTSENVAACTKDLVFADAAVLHQLDKTSHECWKGYAEYKFHKVVNEMNNFVTNDLSAFYFEVIKDALYAGPMTVRHRTQRVLFDILSEMLKILGPITPHLIEEVWEFMPMQIKEGRVHPLRDVWQGPYQSHLDTDWDEIERDLEVFQDVSRAAKFAQEEARKAGKLGSGLACDVQIRLPRKDYGLDHCIRLRQWHAQNQLEDLLVVSRVTLRDDTLLEAVYKAEWSFESDFAGQTGEDSNGGWVLVLPPSLHKCVRCWKYVAEKDDEPCGRCREVLNERERAGSGA